MRNLIYYPQWDTPAIVMTGIVLAICAYLVYSGISGGLYGYWGKWEAEDGTHFTSYLTHRKRDVCYLRDTKSRTIALNAPREWITTMYGAE